jgi:putative peptidoglycan lipid II flippase
MAWRFGTGGELDAFYVAFLLASYFPLVYQSAVADPLVPAYLKAEEPRRFAAAILALTLLAGSVSAVVLLAVRRFVVGWTSPGFSPAQNARTQRDVLALALVSLLYATALGLSSLLAAERRFAVARAALMIVPGVQCAGIFLGAGRWGDEALIWSTVAGYAGHAATVWIAAGLINPFRTRLRDLRTPALRMMIVIGAPMTVTIAAGTLHTFLDRAMTSRLGSGSISALAYAEKLNNVLCTVFLLPLTFVALPYLSAAGERSELVEVFLTNVRAALLLFIPVAVFAGAVSLPLVDVALRRGSFGPHDALRVSSAFGAYMIGIPFYAVAGLTGRAFVATGKTWILALLAPVALLVKYLLNTLLLPRFDVAGAAMATSGVYVIFSIVTLLLLLKWQELRGLRRDIPSFLVMGVASVAGWLAVRPLTTRYDISLTFFRRAAVVGAAAMIFAFVYGALVGSHAFLARRWMSIEPTGDVHG